MRSNVPLPPSPAAPIAAMQRSSSERPLVPPAQAPPVDPEEQQRANRRRTRADRLPSQRREHRAGRDRALPAPRRPNARLARFTRLNFDRSTCRDPSATPHRSPGCGPVGASAICFNMSASSAVATLNPLIWSTVPRFVPTPIVRDTAVEATPLVSGRPGRSRRQTAIRSRTIRRLTSRRRASLSSADWSIFSGLPAIALRT